MGIDVAAALNLLSHELRAPTAVIQGYARMLNDPRADDQAKPRMLAQIQEAAGRIAALGREAVELSRWLETTHAAAAETITLRALIERAIQDAAVTNHVVTHMTDEVSAAKIGTLGNNALVAALAAVVRAASRESLGEPLAVVVTRANDHGLAHDVLVRPESLADRPSHELGPDAPGAAPLTTARGGLGLSLILASVVFDAHGAKAWNAKLSEHGIIGVRVRSKE